MIALLYIVAGIISWVLIGALVVRVVSLIAREEYPRSEITFGIWMWPGIVTLSVVHYLEVALRQPWRWIVRLAGG